MFRKCLLIAALTGLSLGHPEVSTETEVETSTMPEATSSQPLLSQDQREQFQQIINKSAIESRCDKYGGPDAYSEFLGTGHEFGECLESLVDYQLLQREIAIAKQNGSVDDVFKKYCDKTPLFEECAMNATETVKGCLSPAEREHIATLKTIVEQLAAFICAKDGDKIARFIADGGMECVEEKYSALRECANSTMRVQHNFGPDLINNDFMSFDEEHCKQIAQFQACVFTSLETCERSTAANIVDAMLNYARGVSPCDVTTQAEQNAAPCLLSATVIIGITVLIMFLI